MLRRNMLRGMPWWFLMLPPDAGAAPDPAAMRAEVDAVLDALHRSAAEADAATYFGLFAEDSVFIGTDATERWDLPAFRAFAEPHFAEPPAWVYTPQRRDVSFDDRGRTAWFDESLRHERYGEVRGSGVLVRRKHGPWQIAQYVLSFPVPNEVALDVVARIASAGEVLPERSGP